MKLPSYEILFFLARLRAARVPDTIYHELRERAFRGAMLLELVWRATELEVDLLRILE